MPAAKTEQVVDGVGVVVALVAVDAMKKQPMTLPDENRRGLTR